MALDSFVGSFNTGTGAVSSTIEITGVGFQPKAILFWWTGRSDASDAVGRASHHRGFGVACSASDRRSIASNSGDASASSDTNRAHSNDACILTVSLATVLDGALDLQSMDSDGFTLVVDDQLPRDLRVSYLALGGDSLTDVVSGQFLEPVSPETQDITSLSFQPDALILFGASLVSAPPDDETRSQMFVGAASGASNQAVWSGVANDSQGTMNSSSHCRAGECIVLQSNTGIINGRAALDSFLSNGFRLSWTEAANQRYVHFLALKGGNYLVGDLLTQTDTTTDIVESSFGFQPTAALLVSHGNSQSSADTPQDNDRLSIGAFSATTERGAQASLDEDNLADSEVTTAIEFDAVYANIAADSTIQGLMDVKSIDSDGFTLIMDDADPSQAFVWYIAFGPGAEDIVVTPTPITAAGDIVNPTVILGSITIIPNATTAIGDIQNPTVLYGSTVVDNPISSSVGDTQVTVILGSLIITPTAISATGDVVNPTVQLGSVVVDNSIATASTDTQVTVVLGSVVITPNSADSVGDTQNPVVILGSLTLSGNAEATGATVNPTVILGSIVITPTPVSSASTTLVTVIVSGLVITPDPANGVGDVVSPNVVLGSIVISGDIYAVGTVNGPTVLGGGTDITPAPVDGVGVTILGNVILGSILLNNLNSDAVGLTIDGEVILGSSVVDNPISEAVGLTLLGDVIQSSLLLSPNALEAVGDTAIGNTILGSLVLTDIIEAKGETQLEDIILSSIIISTVLASASGSTFFISDPTNGNIIYIFVRDHLVNFIHLSDREVNALAHLSDNKVDIVDISD